MFDMIYKDQMSMKASGKLTHEYGQEGPPSDDPPHCGSSNPDVHSNTRKNGGQISEDMWARAFAMTTIVN